MQGEAIISSLRLREDALEKRTPKELAYFLTICFAANGFGRCALSTSEIMAMAEGRPQRRKENIEKAEAVIESIVENNYDDYTYIMCNGRERRKWDFSVYCCRPMYWMPGAKDYAFWLQFSGSEFLALKEAAAQAGTPFEFVLKAYLCIRAKAVSWRKGQTSAKGVWMTHAKICNELDVTKLQWKKITEALRQSGLVQMRKGYGPGISTEYVFNGTEQDALDFSCYHQQHLFDKGAKQMVGCMHLSKFEGDC